VFDVNETLSDMSSIAALFEDVGLPGHLAATWFAGLLRDGFALTVAGANPSFAGLASDSLGSLLEGVAPEVDEATAHVLSGFALLPLHADVVDGIRALQALDLRLVTLSNGATAVAQRLLERDGLAGASGGLRRELSLAADEGKRRGQDLPDAALLRVAWQGPWPADHPIVTETVDRVIRQLSHGPYLLRYPIEVDDGAAGTPGADMVASFWAVKALAATGRWDAAHDRMERLAGATALGALGLTAAGADPLSGQMLGNYPSSAAHLALVAAALALADGPR